MYERPGVTTTLMRDRQHHVGIVRIDLHRAQLVERVTAHAAVAAREEALRRGQLGEVLDPARADVAAKPPMAITALAARLRDEPTP